MNRKNAKKDPSKLKMFQSIIESVASKKKTVAEGSVSKTFSFHPTAKANDSV